MSAAAIRHLMGVGVILAAVAAWVRWGIGSDGTVNLLTGILGASCALVGGMLLLFRRQSRGK
ncbi:MAG: hypothetical protein IBJ02_08185 [Brevundimonas sp.]|nr:hypothetical protein [Brevundimonas sp.]